MLMPNNASPLAGNATLRDFRESWKLLKSNYRAFLGTEFFGMGASLLTIIGLFSIQSLLDPNFAFNFSRELIRSINYRVGILAIGYIIFTTFINCQTGLAFDVMSSGEMFAEFKSAFSYFRQHWWKYILFSFLMGGFGLWINMGILPLIPHLPGVLLLISNPFGFLVIFVTFGIGFLWYCLIVQSLASINAQGSFIRAIRESFRIFRANPKRILSTWGLYYLLFICPSFVFEIFIEILNPPLEDLGFLVIFFIVFFAILVIFIGSPLRALLVTGLYNNIEFKRFPAISKPR